MDENTEEFEGKNSISADLIRGHINTIILRSLYERDKYGYEIRMEINEKSHGQYELKEPTLYSALKRLENQGYIQAYYKRDETSAGGRRKYFRLTDSGKEIAEHNRSEWEYSRTVIDSLISDRNFDFSQPAPTPVDFKILKQATSRVPVVHGEGEEESKQEKTEGEPAATYVAGQSETVYIDGVKTADDAQTSAVQSSAENTATQPAAESSQPAAENAAGDTKDNAQSTESSEINEVVSKTSEDINKTVSADSTDYTKTETTYTEERVASSQTAPAATENSQSTSEYAQQKTAASAVQQNSYTSQLTTSEEAESKRIAHENYMRLISGAENAPKVEQPEERSRIYGERPEQERDYKNIIDKLFENTLKNAPAPAPAPVQQPEPKPEPKPEPLPERVATPVPAYVSYDYMDVNGKAAGDGLKINTSDAAFAAGSARQSTYNKGATLFKCSLIIGVIMLLEFTLTLLFRDDLKVSVAYPIVILALGVATVLVCGILFGAHYGSRMRKPTSLKYIFTACLMTALLMVIIVLFALVFHVNWSSTTDVLAKVVVPCIIALNIPIFTLSFYLFTK